MDRVNSRQNHGPGLSVGASADSWLGRQRRQRRLLFRLSLGFFVSKVRS
jgi:hypothetical protein